MVEFFLLLGFLGGLMLILANRNAKIMPKSCDLNPDDKKHHWIIRFDNGDRKGYLICKNCGKIPGEDL